MTCEDACGLGTLVDGSTSATAEVPLRHHLICLVGNAYSVATTRTPRLSKFVQNRSDSHRPTAAVRFLLRIIWIIKKEDGCESPNWERFLKVFAENFGGFHESLWKPLEKREYFNELDFVCVTQSRS